MQSYLCGLVTPGGRFFIFQTKAQVCLLSLRSFIFFLFFKFYFLPSIIFKVNELEISLLLQFPESNIGGISFYMKYCDKV